MTWFKAQAGKIEKTAEVWINKAIGSDWAPDWVNDLFNEAPAREFIDAIDALGELTEITVRLNSPGGDVASGITIMNYLKSHPATVNMRVEGVAASIASVVLMAGDTRTMGVGATVMVHDPSGWMGGYYTETEMRDRADQMAKIKQLCVEAYVAGTGKSETEIAELLGKGDSYLTAQESIEWGFATDKDDSLQAVACADPKSFRQQLELSGQLRAEQAQSAAKDQQIASLTEQVASLQPAQMSAQAIIDACSAAKLDAAALTMIKNGVTATQLEQQISQATAAAGICKAAGLESTDVMAHVGDPIAMMRLMVADAQAAADPNTDPHYKPGQSNAKVPNARKAYDQLNNPSGA